MARFIEVTTTHGVKKVINIDDISSFDGWEDDEYENYRSNLFLRSGGDNWHLGLQESYAELKDLIFKAENEQNSIANAILEIDQTLYHRMK